MQYRKTLPEDSCDLGRRAGPVRPRPAKRLNGHHSPLGFVICHATADPRCLGIGHLPEKPC